MIGIVVQSVGLILLGAGVAIEIITQADIWYVVITAGAALFAVGTKVRHLGHEK